MFQQHPATFFLFSLKLSGSLGLLNTAHSIYYFQHYLSQVVVEMITPLSSIHFKLYNVFITNKQRSEEYKSNLLLILFVQFVAAYRMGAHENIKEQE